VETVEYINKITPQLTLRTQKHVKKCFRLLNKFKFFR